MPGSKTVSKKTSKKTSKTTKSKKEPKLKIFCGITKPIPKGHKLGSMKECLEMKQVRYYGLKKLDSKLVESVNEKKNNRTELTIRNSILRVQLNKMKKELASTKDVTKQKELNKKIKEITNEINVITKKLNTK